jgi:hypothetical protein
MSLINHKILPLAVWLVITVTAVAQPSNGTAWRSWTPANHVYYVLGYLDGFNAVMASVTLDAELGIGERLTDEKMPKLHALARLGKAVPAKLTVGDIVDGLDRFYDEPANRNVSLPTGIAILSMRVAGKSEAEVNGAILAAREASSH